MKTSKVLSLLCAGVLAVATMSSCCSSTNVVGISSNSPVGSKVGTSTQVSVLGIGIGGPRQSIVSAAADARIQTISHVEEYNKSYFLGVVTKHTIRVYGE